MQAMNRFIEYFGAYMDEAGRLALADAAVVGMSTYHDRRELHIDLQLPALVETAELERCADQIAAQMGLEKAVLTPHYASAAFSADCLPSLIANIRRHHAEVNGFFKDAKATVVLEINANHPIAEKLKSLYKDNKDSLCDYAKILYAQARLIGGMSVDDPVELSNLVCNLMTK